jgi:hypothetical protein
VSVVEKSWWMVGALTSTANQILERSNHDKTKSYSGNIAAGLVARY